MIYFLRWLVTDWYNKSPKTLTVYTGVRIIGGFSPHMTHGLLYTYNDGLRTIIQLLYVLHRLLDKGSDTRRQNLTSLIKIILKFKFLRARCFEVPKSFVDLYKENISFLLNNEFYRFGRHMPLFFILIFL